MQGFDGDYNFEWEDTDISIPAPGSLGDIEEEPEGWRGSPLQAGMHTAFTHLARLAKTLTSVPPEIRVDYEVPQAQPLRALLQTDYEVTDANAARSRFAFRFRCVGQQRYAIREASRPARDERARWLNDRGLTFHVEDDYGSQWHFSILVRPSVPVSFEFEADIAQQVMRITVSNLDTLDTEHFSVRADAITPAMLGELERLILRRSNRFAEFTGNRVDNEVRARLREAIDERRRSRAEELGECDQGKNESGGVTGPPGRHNGSNGAAEKPAGPVTPVFVGPRDDDGALEWKASAAGEIAAPAPAANAPATYGWLITAGGVEDTAANLGKLGPPGASRQFPLRKVLTEGRQFRMRDRDGKVAFTGNIAGKFKGPEPINDFGLDHGCFRIEYLRGEEWVELKLKRRA